MRAGVRSITFFILLVFSAAGASGAQISDPLWSAAVKNASQTANWVPGDAAFLIQLVDDKGMPQETWQTWYHLSASSTGDVVLDVVRAEHNGKDTTHKEQETQKKRKNMPFTMGDNPFDPLVQDAVVARRLPDTALKNGVTCAAFDFRMKKRDATVISGTAWVDAHSGMPVEVSYGAQPLPRGVFTMTMSLLFSPAAPGQGLLSEVVLEGVGGFLFIKRNFRSTITLGGYWRRGS